ncbi:hypothetical protein SDC9_174525 [bioreactor metagenome]|uniref:Uncharacterized protein n=1 Tax=bioreactor metagenome TaxID=1076179 RepID=A0A645GJJ4_9ZZZZ
MEQMRADSIHYVLGKFNIMRRLMNDRKQPEETSRIQLRGIAKNVQYFVFPADDHRGIQIPLVTRVAVVVLQHISDTGVRKSQEIIDGKRRENKTSDGETFGRP